MADQPGGGGDARPVLVVLCDPGRRPGPAVEALAGRMDVRHTDTPGLAEAVADADVLLLWDFFSTAVRDVWPRAHRLRWIHVAAAGVDRLLFDELARSPVVVTNARGTFDRPIAEFVLMSMLAHAKDTHRSHDRQLARRWQHRETALLTGCNALVVGTGAIGRETARLLHAVGVHVRGVGRSARDGDPDFGIVHASSRLAAHAGWADYLVVAAPLTEQTRGLIDAAVLRAMRPGAYLINVGRGECVVERDLLGALEAGGLAGAALDVFVDEPLPPDHPFWTTPGIAVSAHMSGDAHGWEDRLARQFAENAQRFLDGRPLRNVVDKHLGFVVDGPDGEQGVRPTLRPGIESVGIVDNRTRPH